MPRVPRITKEPQNSSEPGVMPPRVSKVPCFQRSGIARSASPASAVVQADPPRPRRGQNLGDRTGPGQGRFVQAPYPGETERSPREQPLVGGQAVGDGQGTFRKRDAKVAAQLLGDAQADAVEDGRA